MKTTGAVVGLGLVAALAWLPAGGSCRGDDADAKQFDGKTVRQWIEAWDAGQFRASQQAQKALAKAGAPAVPALLELIRSNHRHAGYAMRTLAEMGPAARPALPELLKLARDRTRKNPDGWTWNVPLRVILFTAVAKMSWAAKELTPVLEQIGADADETEQIRRSAIGGLRGMGPAALPALRRFLAKGSREERRSAASAIVQIEQKQGKDRAATLQQIIDQAPFDSNVPDYLADMKRTFNLGRRHEPTERIKQLYRQTLKQRPQAAVAWQLAAIIRNGLAATDLAWAAPSDSYRTRWPREDPNEHYETMAAALQIAFNHSPKDSDLRKKAGLSLAKLRLLQGNWDGMNEMLKALGQPPVSAKLRPDLPPPPFDWSNLANDWKPAEKAMRSGNCTVQFRFVRRGAKLEGVPGVHVLIKKRPPEPAQRAFFTGISVDTLFHASQPLMHEPYDSFGYRGADRGQCRYGISNNSGVVRIEGLPKVPVIVEILVPTSNFAEPGNDWDLLMDTADGLKVVDRSNPRSVSSSKPPAIIELQEGQVVQYPVIFVRSQLTANVQSGDPVDKDSFVLKWDGPRHVAADHYNVKLSVSAPIQFPSMAASAPALGTRTQKVMAKSWEVGRQGVGGLRLVPGNLYIVQVDAIRGGNVIASLPRQRVWVPWAHRKCRPPLSGRSSHRPAFYHDIWFRTNSNGKSLEERLPALIRDSAEQFETEYYRLGMAWLDLHKNQPDAKGQLQRLVDELPAGNVVRMTAQSLLDTARDGDAIPKRLKFVAE